MKRAILTLMWVAAGLSARMLSAQTPDTLPPAEPEEDYSQYEQVQFADNGARRFCHPKILDLTPQRFVSVGWDAQASYRMQSSALGDYQGDDDPAVAEESDVQYTGGLRLTANIPVISRNSVVWQVGANFWDVRYDLNPVFALSESAGLHARLADRGLRTLGLNTTVFKPLNAQQFLYVQVGADLNGDYTFSDLQPLRYLRYSAAVVWGKRPSDYKQWGVGLSRTYRVGELNYLPVLMFNWTSPTESGGWKRCCPHAPMCGALSTREVSCWPVSSSKDKATESKPCRTAITASKFVAVSCASAWSTSARSPGFSGSAPKQASATTGASTGMSWSRGAISSAGSLAINRTLCSITSVTPYT